MDELADVTITAANAEWLADFTRGLVQDDGLAACGNIVPRVRSIYSWEGEVEDDNEALVILHTRKARVPQIIEHTKKEHADDTPGDRPGSHRRQPRLPRLAPRRHRR